MGLWPDMVSLYNIKYTIVAFTIHLHVHVQVFHSTIFDEIPEMNWSNYYAQVVVDVIHVHVQRYVIHVHVQVVG